MEYQAAHLNFMGRMRATGASWQEVADEFFREFKIRKTAHALRLAFARERDMEDVEAPAAVYTALRTTRRTNARLRRESNAIIDSQVLVDGAVESIGDIISKIPVPKLVAPIKPAMSKQGGKMIMELLLSDWHIGKKTDTFNLAVAGRRIDEVVENFTREFKSNCEKYSVERIIIASLGDMIESASMHGTESMLGCEFYTTVQVAEMLKLLLTRVVIPLHKLGVPITFIGIPGNHDRYEPKKTYVDRGTNSLTYIAYSTIQLFVEHMKLKNITFNVSKGSYVLEPIWGGRELICYEHMDEAKAPTKQALVELLNRRQNQFGKSITYIRGGHWHEHTVYDRGGIIVNGSLSGPDGYSDGLGLKTTACQVINTYIETKTKRTSFFHSFPVALEGVV